MEHSKDRKFSMFGLCVGAALGFTYGISTDNWLLGLGLGVNFGICLGMLGLTQKVKDKQLVVE